MRRPALGGRVRRRTNEAGASRASIGQGSQLRVEVGSRRAAEERSSQGRTRAGNGENEET